MVDTFGNLNVTETPDDGDGKTSSSTESTAPLVDPLVAQTMSSASGQEDFYSSLSDMYSLRSNQANMSAYGGGNIPAISTDDYLPASKIPIQKGTYQGRIVGSVPLFAPSIQVPFAAIEMRRDKARAAANAALLKAMKPLQLGPPKTVNPNLQRQINNVFSDDFMPKWQEISSMSPGGWDYLMNGKNPTSQRFQSEYRNLMLMAQYSDYVTKRAAELKTMSLDPNYTVPQSTFMAVNEMLNGYTEIDKGNYSVNFAKILSNLEGSMSLVQAFSTFAKPLKERVDQIVSDAKTAAGANWLTLVETNLTQQNTPEQIAGMKRSMAVQYPNLIYSEELYEETNDSRYAFNNQQFTTDDVEEYILAMFPGELKQTVQGWTKAGSGGSVVTKIDMGSEQARRGLEYVNQFAENMSQSIKDEVAMADMARTDENNYVTGGDGLVVSFKDGVMSVTPSNDVFTVTRQFLSSMKYSPEEINTYISHLASSDGTHDYENLRLNLTDNGVKTSSWYQDKLSRLGLFKAAGGGGKLLEGVSIEFGGKQGAPISANSNLMSVDSHMSKNNETGWSMLMNIDGKQASGVYVPISDKGTFTQQGNNIFGITELVSPGGMGTIEYQFIPGGIFVEKDGRHILKVEGNDGKFAEVVAANYGLKNTNFPNSIVDNFAQGIYSPYENALMRGTLVRDRQVAEPLATTVFGNEIVVAGITLDLNNDNARVRYTRENPQTIDELNNIIANRASYPAGLLGNTSATKSEHTNNRTDAGKPYAIDDVWARLQYATYAVLTSEDFVNEKLDPNQKKALNAAIESKMNEGSLPFEITFDIANSLLTSLSTDGDSVNKYFGKLSTSEAARIHKELIEQTKYISRENLVQFITEKRFTRK